MAEVPAPERSAGDVLDGRYRLLSRLGRGGFGDVWRAEELLPDGAPFREVALKLLVPSFADATRWTEEAKILASFRHPSLVTVYAAGLLEGAPRQPYVAMELLLGSTLADIRKQRPRIPWRRVLGWARDAAAALDVIHARGVVHLDLKPANLFLAQDGALKMLDFGISQQAGAAGQAGRAGAARQAGQAGGMIPEARAPRAPAADDAELATAMFVAEQSSRAAVESGKIPGTTTRRTIAGTPGFMAPEVLELGEPTAATDAYALAVCIALLTTGRLPQAIADQPPEGTTPSSMLGWLSDVRDATLRGDLRDLEADEARLPRGLLALLRRLLAVDPAQRGVSPGHLRAMLDEVWERPHGVPDPPYFGLTPLPAEAEGMLFGRDDDIARLGRELTFEPCVVLQGARGVGKSSLASAGLVPYLARLGVDGKDDWRSVEVRLGEGANEDPDEALRRALAGVDRELEGADIDALAAFCDRSAVGVAIVIDPLDAITTAPAEKSARLCALVEAIAGSARRPGLRAVGAIGEERTQALLDAPLGAAVPAIRARLRYVGPPSAAAVAEIVTAPAKLAGATVEGADRVIADARSELRAEGNRLPYVALALRAFWSDACEKAPERPERPERVDRPDRRAPTLRGARWQELGGVAGALVAHADRVVRGLDPETRAIADELLLRLSATDATPLSWDQAELLDAVGEPGGAEGSNGTARASAERVLARLAGAYLVRIERGQVAIGHPCLLTKWQHLASTRLREMQRLAFLERLREAALAWDRASNHEDFLLPDAVLRDVRARRAWMARGPSARERELVRASLRRRRVQIAKRVAIGGSLVLALAGGLLAKNAYDDRQAAADAARKAAEQRAYAAELVTAERSREDPFQRAALIAEAMRRRSADAALPLDLAMAVADVPRARFLTLEPVASPTFPWNDRWLLGGGPGGALTIVDLWPADAGAIEDMSIDADPESPAFKSYMREPRLIPLRAHADAVAERTPFAFDTAFATRSISGEVRVFRLRDDSSVALAAVAPMRCAGSVRAAEAAPVLACATDEGLARWDLRGAKEGGAAAVDRLEFLGTVLDVSPDGALVAATDGREVRLWEPGVKRSVKVPAGEPVLAARFSPRDRVIALVRAGSFEVLAVDGGDQADESGAPLARGASEVSPTWVRWDADGLALAVCGAGGAGGWHGLGAASGEVPSDPPCAAGSAPGFKGSHGPPQHLGSAADAPELAARVLGPHPVAGGWRLSNGRILTRDLVLFSDGPPVSAMLRFRGVDATGAEEVPGAGGADGAGGAGDPGGGAVSLAAIERIDAKTVAAQVGSEVRLYSAETGKRQLTRKGNLLRVCADGRLLAWERQGAAWRVFDARGGLSEVMVPREPGLVLGADAGCGTLLTQRLDGTLVATRLGGGGGGGGGGGEGLSSRVIGQADGYVYAVKPSPARRNVGSGLWLLASSGAIARYDDASGEARLVGYASPRATAVGDGPRPGDVAYADATGVVVLRRSGKADQVLSAASGATWEDLSVSPDGASMLLASGDRIAVLDMERRELAGEMPAEGRSRFSSWDPGGSVLAWTFDRVGGAEGQVIPRGQELALKVAEAASNLRVENRKLVLKR